MPGGFREGSGRKPIHGESHDFKTPEYSSWIAMRTRCNDLNHSSSRVHGQRGISYCERWENFQNFLEDMGRKPSSNHVLERIDNDGNYELSNCKWEDVRIAGRHTRANKLTIKEAREIRMLHDNGYSQRDLAREFGVGQAHISKIINFVQWKEISTTESEG